MPTPEPLPIAVELAAEIRAETDGRCWRVTEDELAALIDARVRPLVLEPRDVAVLIFTLLCAEDEGGFGPEQARAMLAFLRSQSLTEVAAANLVVEYQGEWRDSGRTAEDVGRWIKSALAAASR